MDVISDGSVFPLEGWMAVAIFGQHWYPNEELSKLIIKF